MIYHYSWPLIKFYNINELYLFILPLYIYDVTVFDVKGSCFKKWEWNERNELSNREIGDKIAVGGTEIKSSTSMERWVPIVYMKGCHRLMSL